MAQHEIRGHPTVLVAVDDTELRCALGDDLRQEGYLVLEAHDGAAAFQILRTSSRSIHLTLINTSMNKGVLATALKQYQPEMTVLFVAHDQEGQLPDAFTPKIALEKVRVFFRESRGDGAVG
jgi:CheY-like chemotaxis protein